jgi:hypothetical protein
MRFYRMRSRPHFAPGATKLVAIVQGFRSRSAGNSTEIARDLRNVIRRFYL